MPPSRSEHKVHQQSFKPQEFCTVSRLLYPFDSDAVLWLVTRSYWLFVTPWTVAHQAPLAIGFSRQEYWSQLPCPPQAYLSKLGIERRSPTSQAHSLLSESPGKPVSTGVSSPSLPQGIFLTQESNQGLLHCRWILYRLSYQGSSWLRYCLQCAYCMLLPDLCALYSSA